MTTEDQSASTESTRPLHILSLTSRDFMRLEVAEIKPDGSLIVLKGKNGAGKTSILESIIAGLAGKRAIVEKPLRTGATAGSVKIELGPAGGPATLVASRTFDEEGAGDLRLRTPDGPVRGAQTVLDRIRGDLSFDPEAFRRMPTRERGEYLLKVVGLDFRQLDQRRQQIFDERTHVGRQQRIASQRAIEARPAEDVEEWEIPDEIQIGPLDVAVEECRAVLTQAEALQGRHTAACEACNAIDNELQRCIDDHQNAVSEVERLEARKDALVERRIGLLESEQEMKEQLAAIKPDEISADVERASGRRDQSLSQNLTRAGIVVKQGRLEELNEISTAENAKWVTLTEQLQWIDSEKHDALAAAEFPVEGLAVTDDGVMFEDLPFDQASESDQIRVSVAMAMELNPDLRVALVRHGSGLDSDQLALVHRLVDEKGGQVWVEMVRTDDDQQGVVEVVDGRAHSLMGIIPGPNVEVPGESPEPTSSPQPS